MALSIEIDGTEFVDSLVDGTLSIERTNGDTPGRAKFTLYNTRPNLLDTLVITDGATTYFDGEVIAYVQREVAPGEWYCDVDGEDAGTVPTATLAPFMLADESTEGIQLHVMLSPSAYRWWRLGEASGTTAADYFGLTDGTYVGSPTLGVTGPGALTDKAATFNGSSQYVTCGTTPLLSGQTDLTIAAWFKTSTKATWQTIYSERVTSSSTAAIVRLGIDTDGRPRFQMRGSTGSLTDIATTAGDWSDGEWHHVAATLTGTSVKLFVDGIQEGSGTKLHVNTTAVNYISIGYDYHSGYYFNGSLDEVAVWRTALSPGTGTYSELEALYLAAHVHRYKTWVRTVMYDALKSPNAQEIGTVTTYEPGLAAGMRTAVANDNFTSHVMTQVYIDSITTTWQTKDLPLYTLQVGTYTSVNQGALRMSGTLRRLA